MTKSGVEEERGERQDQWDPTAHRSSPRSPGEAAAQARRLGIPATAPEGRPRVHEARKSLVTVA
jgi:hypothetical protein